MARARLFTSLLGLVFLVNLARIVFAPLLDVFIAEFPIREATAGLIVTLAWVGSAAPRLPTGWLLTKVPRHHVVVFSGVILTASSALAATAVTVTHLLVGAFLMGIASGIYFVSANPLLSELYPERVGRVMGVHGAANQVAAVLAAPVVALAALVDWRLALWGIAAGAGLITVATWLTARRVDMPRAGAEDRAFLRGALSEWRIIVTALVSVGVAVFVWQGVFNFYELYMQSKGLSPAVAGGMLTLVFAAGVPAFFVGGDLADRLPHVPYLLGIVAIFAASLWTLTRVDGLLAVGVLTAIIGFVVHAIFPATDTYILDTLPDSTRGSAYAAFSSIWMLSQSLGSYALGLLLEGGFGYETVFAGAAVGLGGLTAVLAVLDRLGLLPA